MVTARTNWTPDQIAKQTLGQLNSYVGYWTGKTTTGKEVKTGSTFSDLDFELFNGMAGFRKVYKQKQE